MTAMTAPSAAAARPAAAATTSAAATAARPAAASTIATPIWTISGSPFCSSASGYARDRIAIEVGLVVGEIPPAFDRQRRRSSRFAVALFATVRCRLAAAHLCTLLLENGLTRKPNAITLNRKHFHQHLIALFEFVAHILDAMLRHFADVQQPIRPGKDLNEGAEIRQPRYRSEISLPYLGGSRKIANDLQRPVCRSFVIRSDVNLARIFYVDLYPGLLDNRANHLATGPNHVTNLVDRNLQSVNSRSIRRNLLAMLGNPLTHLLENM